jgi:DNA-binding transcriptional ArsR family regulator
LLYNSAMDKFSALADPTRRHILEMLASSGQLSATQISDKFQVSPSAISQHLKVLREAKLVQMEKRAQQRLYQINRDTMVELQAWTQQITQRWNERFEALDKKKILKKRKRKDVKTNDKK